MDPMGIGMCVCDNNQKENITNQPQTSVDSQMFKGRQEGEIKTAGDQHHIFISFHIPPNGKAYSRVPCWKGMAITFQGE